MVPTDLNALPFQNYAIVMGIVVLGLLALMLVWHLTKAVVKTGLILSALALTAWAAWWLYHHFQPQIQGAFPP